MIKFFRDRDSDVESSGQSTRGIFADNNKDFDIIYTNDSDGAYHVEQDDETEEDNLTRKE